MLIRVFLPGYQFLVNLFEWNYARRKEVMNLGAQKIQVGKEQLCLTVLCETSEMTMTANDLL